MNHNHTHEAGADALAFLMTGGNMNTTAEYWADNYQHTIPALAGISGKDDAAIRSELAYIAGDYASMPDDEVLATFINENAQEVPL